MTRPNLGISPEGRPPYIHIMKTPERDYPGSPYCLEGGRRSEPKPAMSSKPEVARRITHNRTRLREPTIEQALDIPGYASNTPRRATASRRPSQSPERTKGRRCDAGWCRCRRTSRCGDSPKSLGYRASVRRTSERCLEGIPDGTRSGERLCRKSGVGGYGWGECEQRCEPSARDAGAYTTP